GAHQFLLANSSPQKEEQWVAHARSTTAPSKVVFHGTTMDRMHAILSTGLQ
ncbi:hypothetical protein K469DRAFT_460445, partial [Zopfia rhizophila CBS 207.26]